MAIQKLTVTTTLLIEADTPEQAQSYVSSMSLSRIEDEMNQGEAVGQTEVGLGETIATENLKAELEALGSEHSFFGEVEDEQA